MDKTCFPLESLSIENAFLSKRRHASTFPLFVALYPNFRVKGSQKSCSHPGPAGGELHLLRWLQDVEQLLKGDIHLFAGTHVFERNDVILNFIRSQDHHKWNAFPIGILELLF